MSWISVDDRKPQSFSHVPAVCRGKNHLGQQSTWWSEACFISAKDAEQAFDDWHDYEGNPLTVSHWFELPELPPPAPTI